MADEIVDYFKGKDVLKCSIEKAILKKGWPHDIKDQTIFLFPAI